MSNQELDCDHEFNDADEESSIEEKRQSFFCIHGGLDTFSKHYPDWARLIEKAKEKKRLCWT